MEASLLILGVLLTVFSGVVLSIALQITVRIRTRLRLVTSEKMPPLGPEVRVIGGLDFGFPRWSLVDLEIMALISSESPACTKL